ncbi:hypothetical protein [Sphingobium sp. YC-XJ3]|uniref:hypothetical protein n=1 Tax=Sphingobium sp. YC-XJ3 TaxID=3024245 RepID=UPI0023601BF5|nr:hypothetical protein [Sphingobium sp. YC-XJ3]WDA37871.1 hypothetical protein PO876_06730 [Sphingobium sp. YC-XJ3]
MALVHQADTILQNSTGRAYPGVRVQAYVGDVEQQLYSDAGGTPISNVETDANGLYSFWIEEGDYTLSFSIDGTAIGSEDYDLFSRVKAVDLASSTPGKGSDLVGVPDPVAPAILKTTSDIINGLPVSIMRFVPAAKILGIIARTNTDDLQPYFAQALAATVSGVALRELVCPPGLYNVDSSIAMSTANQCLKGPGKNGAEIRIRSTTASAITLANGVAGYGVSGFKITRTGTPVANADGVRCLGTTDNSTLEDLWIEGHWDGLSIGTCDTGHIRKLRLRANLNHGVIQTNSAAYGPSQWDVDDVLCDRNAVDGWRIAVTTGPAGLITGQMRNLRSFANSGWGLNLLGNSTTGIYDLRLSDAFMGSDGQGSVNLDSHGGKQRLSGFFERNGRDATGPTVSTPASGIGVGINITAANTDVNIYGSMIDDNAYDGIAHSGAILTVTGCHIYNNGFAGVAGRRNGILSYSGRLIASGNAIKNTAGSSQLYGIAAGHDDVVLTGNDLVGNATGATTLGGTADPVQIGNAGTGIHRLPAGTALNVGDATGGNPAGTINVATNITKNGTAYANP